MLSIPKKEGDTSGEATENILGNRYKLVILEDGPLQAALEQ